MKLKGLFKSLFYCASKSPLAILSRLASGWEGAVHTGFLIVKENGPLLKLTQTYLKEFNRYEIKPVLLIRGQESTPTKFQIPANDTLFISMKLYYDSTPTCRYLSGLSRDIEQLFGISHFFIYP